MGRKAITDDLVDFRDWLISEGRSMSTAKGYVSNVRCVLREVGERFDNEGFLAEYFEGLDPTKMPARMTAWRAYSTYMEAETDTTVPVPSDRREKKGAAKNAQPLPLEVCAAVRKLKDAAITYRVMTLMVWEDVEFSSGAPGTFIHVRDPLKPGEWYRVEREAIETLMGWAKPVDYAEDQPLVPLEPGSDKPYPKRALQREAQRGAPTLEEKVKAMRRAARAQDGSALAAAYRPDLDSEAEVTPETYHSDYLPVVNENESVEDLLGIDEDQEALTVEQMDEAVGNGVAEDWARFQQQGETRPALIENDEDKPLSVAVRSAISNDSPRPEGAGNDHGPRPTVLELELGQGLGPRPTVLGSGSGSGAGSGAGAGAEVEAEAEAAAGARQKAADATEAAAKMLGVPAAHLQAVLDLMKGPAPALEQVSGPTAIVGAGGSEATGGGNNAQIRDGEAEGPIKERPPMLGSDGLLYDPNDPDYAGRK
jgi:hypothetical protein